MQRKLVSASDLRKLMNEKLHVKIGHNQISFGGIMKLVEIDADGRNWSTSVTMLCDRSDVNVNLRLIEDVINAASAEFNLREDD